VIKKPLNNMNMRSVLLGKLMSFIFGQTEDRLRHKFLAICNQNDALSSNPIGSGLSTFYYKGRKWSVLKYPAAVQGVESLHPELHSKMDKYISQLEELENVEKPAVLGFLRAVSNHGTDAKSLMGLLPSALHEPARDLFSLLDVEPVQRTTDEVAELVKASPDSVAAFKVRMMKNLLEA